jgi:hypothetical protein
MRHAGILNCRIVPTGTGKNIVAVADAVFHDERVGTVGLDDVDELFFFGTGNVVNSDS